MTLHRIPLDAKWTWPLFYQKGFEAGTRIVAGIDRFYTEVLQPHIVDEQDFPKRLPDLQVVPSLVATLTNLIVSGTLAQLSGGGATSIALPCPLTDAQSQSIP